MSKIRVYELAKKMGIPSHLLVDELRALGVEVQSNFSTLDETALEKLGGKKGATKAAPATPKKPALKEEPAPKAPVRPAGKVLVAQPIPFPAQTEAPKAASKAAPQAPAKAAEPPAKPATAPAEAPKPKHHARVLVAQKPSGAPAVEAPAHPAEEALPKEAPAEPKAETKPETKPETKAEPTALKAEAQAPEVAPEAPAAEAPSPKPEPKAAKAAPKAPAVAPKAPAPPAKEEPAAPKVIQPAPPAPRPSGPPPRPHGPVTHHGPGVTPRPPQPSVHTTTGGTHANLPVTHRPGPHQPQRSEPARPAHAQRPASPSPGHGAPAQRPGGNAPHGGAQGQRPSQPYQRPGASRGPAPPPRPSHPPARPGQAPPRAQEPAKPASRIAPPQLQHRKSKRDRRLDKLQAKVDRRERLEQELVEARAKAETGEAVFIREGISVKELADKLNVKVRDIIAKLMTRGILATINQPLDSQVAIELASQFGFSAEVISFEDELVLTQEDAPEEDKVPRAPVVTVMGHVDHGKSSLLEAIHDVDITSKEFGGITQHIGAYRVRHKEREYVFLDTPGHEAFTLMRARGAQVTDIVILVVAADDGVMPQTIEAINHCKAAKVPMVVAINKMDKPGADVDRVKRELSAQGVLTEDWGGEVVSVPVSAKTRVGIEDLLEMVSIVADMLNLKASPEQLASGTVLESRLDRARGPVATVLIQDGHLKVGDLFLCGTTYGHVRNLFDDKGVRIDYAGPSIPVEVLGFPEIPMVGALFQGMDDEAKARQVASFRKEQEKAKALRTTKVRLENVFGAIQEGQIQELPIILKADVHGSLEAINQKLLELSTDEIKLRIVHQGVGAVSESDILLASASNALVIGFNVRPERKSVDLAKAEGVEIHLFTVIYDLIDRMKQALTGMLKPIEEEVILGHAEVRQIFKVSKVGTVAGSIVTDGKIVRSAKVRILRDNVVVHTGALLALKRFKDDASEVKDGTECGISLENYNDIKPGDVIESYEIRFQERTL